MLSATLGIAATILGLNLMIESKMLTLPQDKLPGLGKTLRLLALCVSTPLGIALVAVGFIWWDLATPFISVGFTLIIIAITLLVTSKKLTDPSGKGGRLLLIWSWICVITGIGGVVAPLIQALITYKG